jgi:fatty-acid desaturase
MRWIRRYIKSPSNRDVQILQLILHLSIIGSLFYIDNVILMYGFFIGLLYSWFGANLTAHRWLTHKYIEVKSTVVKILLHYILTLNIIGSGVVYANVHWQHHQHTDDVDLDPHTPYRNGVLKTYLRMNGDYQFVFNRRLFKKMMSDPISAFFHRYYFLIIAATIIILYSISIEALLMFFAIPAAVCFHLAQFQAVLTHTKLIGATQNYDRNGAEHSYNIWWLKPFLFGEVLHNNHHGNPGSPDSGKQGSWKEFDPLYHLVIKPFFSYRKKRVNDN